MTVPTSDNREEYAGNDSTTVFPYAFKIFEDSDLEVYLQDANGDQTPLVLNTDFTVSGAGDVGGGNVTYPVSGSPLATGESLIILRVVPLVQNTDLRNQGAYYPQTVEDELDRSRMVDQQQQEQLDRALQRSEAEEEYDAGSRRIKNVADAVDPNDAINKSQQDERFSTDVITQTSGRWDGKGKRATNFQTSTTPQSDELVTASHLEAYVSSVITGGQGVIPETYLFDGDGSTTVFSTPNITALDPSSYTVTIDGVDQRPGTDYTVDVNAETVTFNEAPPAPFSGESDNVMVRVLGFKQAISEAQNALVDTDYGINTIPETFNLFNSPDAGKGASLVIMEGGPSVETAVRSRLIQVKTIVERDALSGLSDRDQVSVADDGFIYEYDSTGDTFSVLPGRFKGNDGKTYQVVSAVLRQDTAGSGWYALDDSSHAPVGLDPVTPVSESGGEIVIHYDFTSQKVGSLLITPDEGYASLDLGMGASVGSTSAFISLYAPFSLRTIGSSTATQGIFGTKGADWDAVFDTAAGTITVTHGDITHSDSQGWPVFAILEDSEDASSLLRVTAATKTGYTLQNYGPLAGRIRNDLLVQDEIAETVTPVWDGTSKLTITHPPAVSAYDAQVTAVSPQFNAAVRNASSTTIEVEYYDISTGSLYTGSSHPATSLNWARSSSFAKYEIPGNLKTFSGRSGPSKLNASGVSGSNRNLWIYGVFEI